MTSVSRICLIALGILIFSCTAGAQHIWYEISGGPAISHVSKDRDPSRYANRLLLQGGITAFIPFNNKVAFKTGAIYQYKGIASIGNVRNKDTSYLTYALESRSNYHFLNIPLQLAVNIGDNPQGFWRVAGGMSYGILMSAKKTLSFQTYEGNNLLSQNQISFKPIIGSDRSGNYEGLPGQEGSPVRFFIPSLRLDVTYQWQERLLLSAFYEYDLEDVRVRTVDNAVARLHYAGISFGVIFW